MGGNPNGLQSLAKYSKLPVERIKYVSDAGVETIREIDRGIVFLMAFWSIYSVKAFAGLTEVLIRMHAERLDLIVVDVDGSSELEAIPEFKERLSLGYGETAWVRNGKLVALSGNPDAACFEANTVALLGMP